MSCWELHRLVEGLAGSAYGLCYATTGARASQIFTDAVGDLERYQLAVRECPTPHVGGDCHRCPIFICPIDGLWLDENRLLEMMEVIDRGGTVALTRGPGR